MKKYNKIVIVLAVIFFLSPVIILAQGNGKGGNQTIGSKACEAISQIYSKIEQKMVGKENQLNEKQAGIANRYRERVQTREMSLEQRREKWDENRAEHFAMLEERAQTDEQKQAVIAFVKTVTEAVKERREAFDRAILDFQNNVGSFRDSRMSILSDAVKNYKDSVEEVFNSVQQSCENGVDISTVRNNLRESLQEIKDQYREDVDSFQGDLAQMQDLVEMKKEAMNEAKNEFQQVLEEALTTLEAAFPGISDIGQETEQEE